MRRRHPRATVAVPTALLFAVAACSSTSEDDTEPEFSVEPVEWTECEGELEELDLECATLTVPVDWENPGGDVLDLALSKREASGDSLGTLVVNPGGPGAAGTAMPGMAEHVMGPDIAEQFDIVGFDPRGVQGSEVVTCEVSLATVIPDDEDEYADVLESKRAEAAECAEHNPHLEHLDTVNAAHDVDAIRQGLDLDTINWFGFSYGTQLGVTYAELFPEHTEAMVLDAMYDHTRSSLDIIDEQSEAREAAFERFIEWCETAAECEGDIGTQWDELVIQANNDPLSADEALDIAPESVDGTEVVDATAAMLSSPQMWPTLAAATADGLDGDGSEFANMLADDGTMVAPMVSVRCLDWPVDEGFADFETVTERADQAHVDNPRFGAHSHWYYSPECVEWQPEPTNPPSDYDISDDVPVLVIGGKWDPATPYEWAQQAAEDIPSATLLTYNGDGHGAAPNSECAQQQAATFLSDPESEIDTECD